MQCNGLSKISATATSDLYLKTNYMFSYLHVPWYQYQKCLSRAYFICKDKGAYYFILLSETAFFIKYLSNKNGGLRLFWSKPSLD